MGESFMILSGVEDSGFHMQSQLIWYKNQFILGRADYHWRHEIIWYGYTGKNHYWCGDRTQDTVWEIHKDSHTSYTHPTQKPVELSLKAIKNSSKSDNIILDPFLGSGSCLIACEQSNRICYGIELDPGYIDVVITRWENHTGKKAKKV
jgi:DNA modification methylase